MYITGRDPLIQKEYREELLRQAEPWHLLRTGMKRPSLLAGLYRGVMLQLGLWLEKTGCRIKSRYAAPKGAANFPRYA